MTTDSITVRSRYNDQYKLIPVSSNESSITYRLDTDENAFIRVLYADEKATIIGAIDPPGGPMLIKGMSIQGVTDNKISKITCEDKIGFLITFEKNHEE